VGLVLEFDIAALGIRRPGRAQLGANGEKSRQRQQSKYYQDGRSVP
jgi:hypothetical protein